MERTLYGNLLEWKASAKRKPLVLRGVRQCGKTYLLRKFGEENYRNVAYVNFESDGRFCRVFERDYDPHRIVRDLSVVLKEKIHEDTLIFFDEIQSCPRALTSLKYFHESAPGYHVVCAGSLLGLQLTGSESFPVGKVNFLDLAPMGFREFLMAAGRGELLERIDDMFRGAEMSEAVSETLWEEYRAYCCVGGMPEAVLEWVTNGDMNAVDRIHREILGSYRLDFLRHVPEKDVKKVNAIWESIPAQLSKENRRFVFGHAVEGARAKDLADALQWLSDAGLVHVVRRVEFPGMPLSSAADPGVFKVYACDIGLLRAIADFPAEHILLGYPGGEAFIGGLTENHVLCEVVAETGRLPYFWRRGSVAEVDFLMQIGAEAVPVEVKSGKRARSAGLKAYIDRHSPRAAAIACMSDFRGGDVSLIPLYAAWKMPGYLESRLR
ncbi:MAG: ATP-binding protein [Thermoplasmatales archaeon]|nr:ATP-binding protein [Thermoplasmatales archaeon]